MKLNKYLLILLLVSFSRCLFADGVFVWNKGIDLYEPSQKAVILHAGDTEDLILQVKYEGQAKDFAWLVPLPAKPEVSAVQEPIFDEISEYTQKRQEWYAFHGFMRTGISLSEEVKVLERKKVGVYDVAVIKADTAETMMKWLSENGYSIPEKAKTLLNEYISKGWVFTALRIHPEEEKLWVEKALNQGTLIPLKFTFKSQDAIYPLKISSLNKGPTEVLLYVFADDVLVHPDFEIQAPRVDEFFYYSLPAGNEYEKRDRKRFPDSFDFEHKYFRIIKENELTMCHEVLPRLKDGKYFLSKLRHTFESEEMQEDIVLRPPEKLSSREQYYFVKTQVGHKTFDNSLLLRTRAQVSEYFATELRNFVDTKKEDRSFLSKGFEFLAIDPSERDLEIMKAGAQHQVKPVRSILGGALYGRFGSPFLSFISSPPSYAEKFVPILELLMSDLEPYDNVNSPSECLAAIGSDEALNVLKRVIKNAPGVTSRAGITTYIIRSKVLSTIANVNNRSLIEVYEDVFRNHKEDMLPDEIHFCIYGLGIICDPKTIPLAEEILAFCIEKHNTRDINASKQLLQKLTANGGQ